VLGLPSYVGVADRLRRFLLRFLLRFRLRLSQWRPSARSVDRSSRLAVGHPSRCARPRVLSADSRRVFSDRRSVAPTARALGALIRYRAAAVALTVAPQSPLWSDPP